MSDKYFNHPKYGKCVIVCTNGKKKCMVMLHFLRGCQTVKIKDLTKCTQETTNNKRAMQTA